MVLSPEDTETIDLHLDPTPSNQPGADLVVQLTKPFEQFSRKLFPSKHRRPRPSPSDPGPSISPATLNESSKNVTSGTADEASDQEGDPSISIAVRSLSTIPVLPLPSRSEILSADRKKDPLGLSLLYSPIGDRTADIIFIHGLGGSSRLTWCKDERLDLFWPQIWLPKDDDLHRARIFTYGYNAHYRSSSQISSLSINDFSKNLLYDMRFGRDLEGGLLDIGEVPIIFVTHSMGGLVFKKAYLDAQLDSGYSSIMGSTKAVVFLATPHRGSDLAPYLNRLLSVGFGSSSKQYVAELHGPSDFLRNVNEQFRHVAHKLDIFSFYETLQTPLGVFSALILDPESAKLGYPKEVSRSVNADHRNVCKFSDTKDPNYRVVIGALKSLVSSYSSADTDNAIQELDRLRGVFAVPPTIEHDLDLFSERRTDGTCQWILEQDSVRSWRSSSSSEILLLHGRPARGKSVIAAFLANYLVEHEAYVQFFFFRAGDESKRSMAALIKSLAFQTAQQVPAFRRALVEITDSGYKAKNTEWRSMWKKLFVDVLFEMELSSPAYWIIDGIDEAISPHHVFELLSDLQLSKVLIRVIATSRWTQSLSVAFKRTGSRVSTATFSLDHDLSDIRHCVEDALRFNNWGEDITGKVVEKVLDGSNNNFLWVHLILEELQDCNTEEDIWNRLLELPPEMDGLYKRMEESISHIRRPSDKNLARQLLIWAIHARRTLSAEELSDALEPEFGKLLDISQTASRLCGHFITVERGNNVGLIHQTAREYLATTTNLPFSLEAKTAHGELFKQAMAAFLDRSVRSKLYRSSPNLLEYRSTSWPHHLAATEMRGTSDEQLGLLSSFFTHDSVLVWIQVLASLDQLPVLLEASHSLSAFVTSKRRADDGFELTAQRCDELEVLEGWSRDLPKLLGKFGVCLAQKPETIYDSVAPFCPLNSSIYKLFGKRQTSTLTVKGTSEDWDDCLARVPASSQWGAKPICCSGRYIAVGNSEQQAIIWDSMTFHQVNILWHGETISALCFNSKGDRLATYGHGHTKIWSPQSGKLLLSMPNPPDMHALCLQFVDKDKNLIMGSDYRCVLRADLDSKEQCAWATIDTRLLNDVERIEGTYLNSPVALALSPDGSNIAAAYRSFPLVIWSISQAKPFKRVTRLPRPGQVSEPLPFASRVSWHPSGDELLGIFMDGYSFKLNIVDGSYQEHAPAPGQMPSDIICSPNGLVYAICGFGGTIRLYDYQSSTLIYQLISDDLITAFCFSDDGRKFYDIRGSHCSMWEPNAIMRHSTADGDPALSQTADWSLRQAQVVSKTFVDNSVPILIMAPAPRDPMVCFGDEDGAVDLFDYETSKKVSIGQTPTGMSIEYLAWNEDGSKICYAELNARLTVVHTTLDDGQRKVRRVARFKLSLDSANLRQILFLPGCDSLLVSSTTSTQVWAIEPPELKLARDYGTSWAPRKWIAHPRSSAHLLSITPKVVSIHNRDDLEEISSFQWSSDQSFEMSSAAQSISSSPRQVRSSDVNPADITEEVDSVEATFVEGHVLVKISRKTRSRRLRPRFLVFDARDDAAYSICPVAIPPTVAELVEMPLTVLPNRKLIFIDRSFWVCSWHMGPSYGEVEEEVQKHFFIPRDWLPLQGLGLLKVTATGAILIPRKGGVSVINSSIGSTF